MIIGLTGGIGSGKSEVGRILAELGAHVIDTDKVGHQVYLPGTEGWRTIVETFGEEVVATDGTIDRARLGAVVFADRARLRQLNAIVHPRIFQEVAREIAERRQAGFEGHVVLEAPVLLEARSAGIVEQIWVVTAPRAVVEHRLAERRGLSAEEIEARVDAQLDEDERRRHADIVIENASDLAALRAQVEAAWRTLPAIDSAS